MKINKSFIHWSFLPTVLLPLADCKPMPRQPRLVTDYKNAGDSTYDYYTKCLPKDSFLGLLVIENGKLTPQGQLAAYNEGVMTLTVMPAKSPLDMLTEIEPLNRIDSLVGEVIREYHLPQNKWLIGGMSVEGTGAIRYVQYCRQGHSREQLSPAGVFGIDPPLDYERLWRESENSVKRKFSPNAVDEGTFLMAYFKNKLGGSPHERLSAYQAASPFSYSAGDGGNAHWLDNVPIEIYVEPNISWWIENRRKDFYDLNAADQAALFFWFFLFGFL